MPISSSTELLWLVFVTTAVVVMLASFLIAIVIINQRRVIAAQMEKLVASKHAEEILRQMPRRIVKAQEEERGRVARELHDGVNQMLAATTYRLHTLRSRPAVGSASCDKCVRILSADLERTMEELRRISHNLHPKVFDDLGFHAAVRVLCDEFSERTHLEVDCDVSKIPVQLSPETGLGVFRILQEALRNIEKHAQAHHVTIESTLEDSRCRTIISDDGRGFDSLTTESDERQHKGFGFSTMRERAALIAGTLDIRSRIGGGTSLILEFPATSSPPT